MAYSLKKIKSIREMSEILDCSHGSISREIKRNSENGNYNSSRTEKLSEEQKKNCNSTGKLGRRIKISKRCNRKLRKVLPKKLLKSRTFDNVKEFLKYESINLETLIDKYFKS